MVYHALSEQCNHHCICQICLYVLTHYITTEREVQQIWALSYRKVAHKWANVGFLTKQLHTGINSQTLLDKPHQKNPLQISTGKWYHDLLINKCKKRQDNNFMMNYSHALVLLPTCMKSKFECIICIHVSKVISTLLILHKISLYYVTPA